MDPKPVSNSQPLVPMSSRGKTPFYNISDPFPRPRPPVCVGLSSKVLSLRFRAGWVWLKLNLSLGYPSSYPSPVLFASSSASNPHSSSLLALSAIHCKCARGRATIVLVRNCSGALVGLSSPKSRPCGFSSAAVGLITPYVSRSS